jgi:hypothetical protein
MTKYRLNIKYPIEEKDGSSFVQCRRYDGETIFTVVAFTDGLYSAMVRDSQKITLPESWIEEIKEGSEFDKWNSKEQKGALMMTAYEHRRQAWKASQENRDLLYKPLMDSVRLWVERHDNPPTIVKEAFEKINEQL